jgi:hypothetical protein
MKKFKIDVVEHNAKVTSVYLRIALGPWPIKNWSQSCIYFYDVQSAIKLRDKLLAMPENLQYYGFILKNADIDKAIQFKNDLGSEQKYSL